MRNEASYPVLGEEGPWGQTLETSQCLQESDMIAISPSDICQSLHTAAPGGGVTLNEPDTVGVYNCPISW